MIVKLSPDWYFGLLPRMATTGVDKLIGLIICAGTYLAYAVFWPADFPLIALVFRSSLSEA